MIPLAAETLRRLNIDIATTYLLISRSQYRVFLIAHFVAPLSILGSLAIIYRILRFDRYDIDARNKRAYHRILVAMSACDLLGSAALMFGTTPIPRETLLETARGNTATCTAQGFFFHWFAQAVLYYNTGLMIYFVMTIRYNWTESRVAKWLEPLFHLWSLLVPFAQAVAGLFLHIFNPIGFGNFCYISPYPLLCGIVEPCTRGQSAAVLYNWFATIPESVALAIIYVSIVLIYCTVRGQARRALAITANRDSVRARTKAVAVQSWLFALIFFNTWVYSILAPLLNYTVKQAPTKVRAEYILSVMSSTFLPLQGFFNFCIYIRPRFMGLWRDQESFCGALKLAVFGGRESSAAQRRRSTIQRRKSSIVPKHAMSSLPVTHHETVAADSSDGKGNMESIDLSANKITIADETAEGDTDSEEGIERVTPSVESESCAVENIGNAACYDECEENKLAPSSTNITQSLDDSVKVTLVAFIETEKAKPTLEEGRVQQISNPN
jgi:hypothetical protein